MDFRTTTPDSERLRTRNFSNELNYVYQQEMERLGKNPSTLKLLHKAKPSLRQIILTKASPELIRCICDCALNVLHRNIAITPHCKRKLSRHKTSLRKLTDKKASLYTSISQMVRRKG